MVRIPLLGVPRHLKRMVSGVFTGGLALIAWRIVVLGALTFVLLVAASSGIGGVSAIILGFTITTLLSYFLRDDILAVWRDIWNAQWAEVRI